MAKKNKKTPYKQQVKNGVNKVITIDSLVKKGLIAYDIEEKSFIIHYLLWHSYNNQGLAKLAIALSFYYKMKWAMAHGTEPSDGELTLYVNYGDEENEYGRTGIVKTVKYHPINGFSATT